MSNAGTPPGWYPDPENPGQSRYWDGAAWAAPVAATPGGVAPGGTGSGGNKTPLIVVAVIAVLALIGGGAYFLLSGDDSDDDEDKVATSDGDDEDDDGDDGDGGSDGPSPSGVDELPEDEFIEFADGVCGDLEDDLDSISELYFGGVPGDELEELPNSVLSAFESEMLDATGDAFSDMRSVGPEGEVDDWLDLVDDWEDLYENIIDQLANGNFDGALQFDGDVVEIEERSSDFGLTCLGGSGTTPMSPDPSPSPGTGGSSPGGSTGGSGDVGEATPPPSFEDSSLEGLGEDCYSGDLEACDDLYFQSPIGSPEEDYGDTCGGRTDGGTLCQFLDD